MFYYNNEATTWKNINKFNYELYDNLSINQLKYLNDSAAAVRFIDSLTSTWRQMADDFPYLINFSLLKIDYLQIDRLNKFFLNNIPNISLDTDISGTDIVCYSVLQGYSKYTGQTYNLEYVADSNDFTRHSLPCDLFITNKINIDQPLDILLTPNVWKDVQVNINKTSVTIKPVGPMNVSTIGPLPYLVINIAGINIKNEYVEEEILVNMYTEYVSKNEFIFIDKIKCINSTIIFEILLYPFINGKSLIWDSVLVDREEYDRYSALLEFDDIKNRLVFSTIHFDAPTFPVPTNQFKFVNIGSISPSASVIDYFIDQNNGLFFLITNENKLYCYPLIIPKLKTNIIDNLKTGYQSTRVEYVDDTINEQYIFYVFPTSKTNDIEMLDIYVNGNLVDEGIVLDLIRENISTNKFTIPYTTLFTNGDASVEFITNGAMDSVLPLVIPNPLISQLFIKDLSSIPQFTNINQTIQNSSIDDKSTTISYNDYQNGSNITLASNSSIFKNSQFGNILLDGYVFTNVFNTFCYSQDDNSIITHDSITNIVLG